MARTKTATGHILGLIPLLSTGDHFYSDEKDSTVQRYASMHGRKVETEICLITEGHKGNSPITKKVTKVTIV